MPKSSAKTGTMGRKEKSADSVKHVSALIDLISETKTELKIALQSHDEVEVKRNEDFLVFLRSMLEQTKPEQRPEFWPKMV